MEETTNFKSFKILYLEENNFERDILLSRLSQISDNIFLASNHNEALKIYQDEEITLIISEIKSSIGGLNFIKEIRALDYWVPIIIVSTKDNSEDLFECLNLSIQSYLEKPISKLKLQDALNNILKYLDQTIVNKIKLSEEIFYNPYNNTIENNNEIFHISKKEKLLLDLLLKNKNRLVSYRNIEAVIWDIEDKYMTENALKNLIRNLRNKTAKNLITNISGLGYKLILN